MTDVFRRLAQKLDQMPNGYPATKDGVELRILEKIFSPEEAHMALQLRDLPENVQTISKRLGKSVSEMKEMLDYMEGRGQISRIKIFGEDRYMLMPFIIGIYEYQLNRLDKELADLFEEYAPTLLNAVGGFEPALTRVVPVNASIDAKHKILHFEDIHRVIISAKSFSVRDCICRWEQELQGHPCKHPMETCLTFSSEEGAFDHTTIGRPISKEEALTILDETKKAGLIPTTYNVKSGHTYICNCCPCCCGLIRGLKEMKAPHLVARSNFVASISQASCKECGVCAERRCPMEAILEQNGAYSVLPGQCIGCGVCTTECPTGAITLITRPASEQNTPSANILDWRKKRSASRGLKE